MSPEPEDPLAEARALLDALTARRPRPLVAVAALTQLQRLVDRARDAAVAEARFQVESWQAIADAAGVRRQSAWERWGNPDP